MSKITFPDGGPRLVDSEKDSLEWLLIQILTELEMLRAEVENSNRY